MPAAPRPKGKGQKIAWAILGKPASMQKQNSAFSKKVNQELTQFETRKMR